MRDASRRGDRLLLAPLGREIRVRSLRAQNEAAESGAAGQRCALNISGARVEKADISRGDWLIAPALAAPTSRADVHLRLLPSETRPLRHWTPVHVHMGAADISGRIALLEDNALRPGESGLAQIVLDQPTSALCGDRFVIRDQSAQRTIGGGRIIDPVPPARNTRKPERLAVLRALDRPDDSAALDALVEAAPLGIDLDHFALVRNLEPTRRDALVAARDLVRAAVPGKTLLFAQARWTAIRDQTLAAFEAYQAKNPDSFGATVIEIQRTAPVTERPAIAAAIDSLSAEKALTRFGQLLHLPGHAVKLSLEEENLWFEVERAMRAQGHRPATPCRPRRKPAADRGRVEAAARKARSHGQAAARQQNLFRPAGRGGAPGMRRSRLRRSAF